LLQTTSIKTQDFKNGRSAHLLDTPSAQHGKIWFSMLFP